MSRPGRPWYRRSRSMWFANISGKQTPLGISDPSAEADAIRARQKLIDELSTAIAAKMVAPAEPGPSPRRVGDAVADFLLKKKTKLEPGSYENYRHALGTHFRAAFGARDLASLTAEEIEEWANRPAWSSTYRHNTLGAVMTFLKWAGRPLALARPPKESRGAAAVLSDEQFEQVLQAYDGANGGDFRELLKLLRETGARPQEGAQLTVETVDWSNKCARLDKHKNKRHGKQRVIHFGVAAVAILEAQREKYGTGLLFRTTHGNAYGKKAIALNMIHISERVGFRAIAYGERHGFCTRALCAGVPEAVVAALVGHSSSQMIATNYGHVGEQSRVLKDALNKMSGGG